MQTTTSVRAYTRITYLGKTLLVIIFIFRPVLRQPVHSGHADHCLLFSTCVVYHFAYFGSKVLGAIHLRPRRLCGSARNASDSGRVVAHRRVERSDRHDIISRYRATGQEK